MWEKSNYPANTRLFNSLFHQMVFFSQHYITQNVDALMKTMNYWNVVFKNQLHNLKNNKTTGMSHLVTFGVI